MKKLILLLVLILLLFPFSALAGLQDSDGVHGDIFGRKDTCNDTFTWGVEVFYKCNSFKFGISEQTHTPQMVDFSGIPAFVPDLQRYETYVTYNFTENVSFKVSQWCIHSVLADNTPEYTENLLPVSNGMSYELRFEF